MQNQKGIFPPQRDPARGGTTLLIGIIIVVVAVIAVGGVFVYQFSSKKIQLASQTQQTQNQQQQTANQQTNNIQPTNQIAGWQTYTNSQYGFEVEYPEDFITSDQPTGNGNDIIISFGQKNADQNGSAASMSISIDNNYARNIATYPKGNLVNINGMSVTHSGGLRPNGMNVYSEEYVIVKNNTAYSIHIGQDLSFGDPLQQDLINNMNKIVQSFKFTTPTNQTAGWKTYTNTQYGFQINYPVNKYKIQTNDSALMNNLAWPFQLSDSNDNQISFHVKIIAKPYDSVTTDIFNQVAPHATTRYQPTSLTLNGSQAFDYRDDLPGVSYGYDSFLLLHNNLIYEVYWAPSNDSVLKKIASTFKFTNQTVQPSITILSPNGGETVNPGQYVKITWNVDSNYPNVQVMVVAGKAADGQYTNNGSMASFRGYVIYTGANAGSFYWTVPTDYPGAGDYLIRIEPQTSNGQASGQVNYSDNYFTIK